MLLEAKLDEIGLVGAEQLFHLSGSERSVELRLEICPNLPQSQCTLHCSFLSADSSRLAKEMAQRNSDGSSGGKSSDDNACNCCSASSSDRRAASKSRSSRSAGIPSSAAGDAA